MHYGSVLKDNIRSNLKGQLRNSTFTSVRERGSATGLDGTRRPRSTESLRRRQHRRSTYLRTL